MPALIPVLDHQSKVGMRRARPTISVASPKVSTLVYLRNLFTDCYLFIAGSRDALELSEAPVSYIPQAPSAAFHSPSLHAEELTVQPTTLSGTPCIWHNTINTHFHNNVKVSKVNERRGPELIPELSPQPTVGMRRARPTIGGLFQMPVLWSPS